MTLLTRAIPALAATLTPSACVSPFTGQSMFTTGSITAQTANTSAATWQMPWQVSPITIQSESREPMALAWVPQTGYVRGTPAALASLGRPL